MASYPASLNQKGKHCSWRDVAPDVCDLVFEFENTNVRTYVCGIANGNLKILGDTVILLISKSWNPLSVMSHKVSCQCKSFCLGASF